MPTPIGLLALPIPIAAIVLADAAGMPDLAQYGFAGTVLGVAVLGVAWWARDTRRREDALRSELRDSREEIKVLNDRMLSDLVPLTVRATESLTQMARLFDVQLEGLQRRERG